MSVGFAASPSFTTAKQGWNVSPLATITQEEATRVRRLKHVEWMVDESRLIVDPPSSDDRVVSQALVGKDVVLPVMRVRKS